MHDTGARDSVYTAKRRKFKQQRIDERIVICPGRGMHYHALRLVDYGKIFILPYYLYRNILRGKIELFGRGIDYDDDVSRFK